MEMGLSQADAARRLNVSRSVVQRLWDQYQSEDSVSKDLFQADHELQHLQKTKLFRQNSKRRTTTVPQLVADHFQASGRRISATTVRNRLQSMQVCIKKTSCVRSPQRTTARNRLCWAREHVSWTQLTMWLLCCSQTKTRFTMESDSGVYCLEQQRTYHQSNTVERWTVMRTWWNLVWAWDLARWPRMTCMCSMEEP
ncbi:transposable element Tcb2 transposase [Trichonephila clavipes]|nr:transposable element Tcb2 transposase [Trichonephila clavipes]